MQHRPEPSRLEPSTPEPSHPELSTPEPAHPELSGPEPSGPEPSSPEVDRSWRKIAVLRPGRIGDYLCATPAVRALRRAVPGAELHYVALPLVEDLVARNPNVDRFVAFPGFPYIAEQFFDARRALRWLAACQDERYDLVLQAYGSGVYANPIALLMGARYCAGFVRPGDVGNGSGRLDAALPLPSTGHEVDRVLALVRHLGVRDAGRGYDLVPAPGDRERARRLLDGLPRPLIGLHRGSRDAGRRLPPDGYAGAAAILHARYRGGAVLLGGDAEVPDTRALSGLLLAAGAPHRDLAGRVPLGTAAAVIAELDALLTTDSGPAHLAYATGTPSVTVFVASDPDRWGPPAGGPHIPLDLRSSAAPTPEVLEKALARALAATRPSRALD